MKVRSNIKAGVIAPNHNEKTMSDNNGSFERKRFAKKLSLKKETIRELKESDLKAIAGGMEPESDRVCSYKICR